MKKWKPYLTGFRIRALLETQYRAAALGGFITQAFFGLILIYLYQALYAGSDPQQLQEVITYVWMQQMFFRALFGSDAALAEQIRTGGIACSLCLPVDQHAYWLCRDMARKTVGPLMRTAPMLLLQLLLPADIRIALPESPLAFAQFLLAIILGIFCMAQINAISSAITMKTLDDRGISSMIQLTLMLLSGNIIPLTLFPDSVRALIQYQPFAQILDAPIRMYLHAQGAGEWLLNMAVQLGWIVLLTALGRSMWRRQLQHMTVQGG